MLAAPTIQPAYSSSSLIGKKSGLYVVYEHCRNKKYMYTLYALDPSKMCDDGVVIPMPEPLVVLDHFNYPHGMGFACLGSKIYMIGGKYVDFVKGNAKITSDVYVYDIEEKLLKKGTSMNGRKRDPIVVTVYGKIYVISSSVYQHDPKPRAEVFDPIDDSWTILPDLIFCSHGYIDYDPDTYRYADDPHLDPIYDLRNVDDCRVEAHAVHGSTIFLSTRQGIYYLDVIEPSVWQKVELVENSVDRFPFTGKAQFVDGIWYGSTETLINLLQAYDIDSASNNVFIREYKLLDVKPKFKRFYFRVNCCVVDLGDGKLGFIRTGMDKYPYAFPAGSLYITLDVFQVAERHSEPYSLRFTRLYSSTYLLPENTKEGGFLRGCFYM